MSASPGKPSLVYVFQRRQIVKIRAASLDLATREAEASDVWSVGEISLIDVVEE